MTRELKYYQALNEAVDICMRDDPSVYVIGLGVPDPKGVFGSTLGLVEKHGSRRVLDMPAAENAMTGVVIGTALAGMRPVMTHQRVDFALLALEELVNQAANWHYMFGGQASVPMVVRLIVGRGWGQGPQHSQSLQTWFAHVPGLKVVMPATPYDAKGLLVASIEDDNPVVMLEHRWLYNIGGPVPEERYRVPLGQARVARAGGDVTVVATSYMLLEALRAAERLASAGVHAEVIDPRTLKPLDDVAILDSVRKTGRLVVVDSAWRTAGFAGEIITRIVEQAFDLLKAAPRRVTLPDCPTPTSPALSSHYYPRSNDIEVAVRQALGLDISGVDGDWASDIPLDVPDASFTGPF